jgi:hypothetical protein
MKKILFVLLFVPLVSFGQVKIYKGLIEGMSKKEAKNVIKKNKNDYKVVAVGNGVEWTIRTTSPMYNPENYLVGVTMWPKGFLLTGTGYEIAVSYLETTKQFFIDRNYSVILESTYWNAPKNFNDGGFLYGCVLLSPDDERVIHIYPSETPSLDGKTYRDTAYAKVMTKSFWDKTQEARKEVKKEEIKDTDF